MAKLSYVDTIAENEGVSLAFDQTHTVETGQMLMAMVGWFELATGRKLFATGVQPAIELPEDDMPQEFVVPQTADAASKKTVRRKRRTKAEMAAEAKANGEDIQEPENKVIATITGDGPTPDDVRSAAENFLGEAGAEGPTNFRALLSAFGAEKISELDAPGRTAVMAKLLETPADG